MSVVLRCLGVIFERVTGHGTRATVSVLKVATNLLYFDMYGCCGHVFDANGGSLTACRGRTRVYVGRESCRMGVPVRSFRGGVNGSGFRTITFCMGSSSAVALSRAMCYGISGARYGTSCFGMFPARYVSNSLGRFNVSNGRTMMAARFIGRFYKNISPLKGAVLGRENGVRAVVTIVGPCPTKVGGCRDDCSIFLPLPRGTSFKVRGLLLGHPRSTRRVSRLLPGLKLFPGRPR